MHICTDCTNSTALNLRTDTLLGTHPSFFKSIYDASNNLIICRSQSERVLFVTVCASCGGTQSGQRGEVIHSTKTGKQQRHAPAASSSVAMENFMKKVFRDFIN